jgi:hypothetical protein
MLGMGSTAQKWSLDHFDPGKPKFKINVRFAALAGTHVSSIIDRSRPRAVVPNGFL